MLNVLAGKVRYAKLLVNENSTTLLTGVGVVGTITTAYLSGRASFKAAQLLEDENRFRREALNGDGNSLTLAQKTRIVWRLYIPPFLTSATTVIAIVAANKIASKKIAALAIAGGLSDRALQEYKQKVIERWGDSKETSIRDEIAQDRINQIPLNREIILAGTGDVLCFDMTTGRYFVSSIEQIRRAENKINHQLIHFMSASLSEFYDEIGLPPTSYSDNVGWNMNNNVEVKVSAVLSTDNRPCMAIDFSPMPHPEFSQNVY